MSSHETKTTLLERLRALGTATRMLAAALAAALALLTTRPAAATTEGSTPPPAFTLDCGDCGTSSLVGPVIGITAAVVAVVGLGAWWYFSSDDDADEAPAALSGSHDPVDVSGGTKIGFDCPAGTDGSATVACW